MNRDGHSERDSDDMTVDRTVMQLFAVEQRRPKPFWRIDLTTFSTQVKTSEHTGMHQMSGILHSQSFTVLFRGLDDYELIMNCLIQHVNSKVTHNSLLFSLVGLVRLKCRLSFSVLGTESSPVFVRFSVCGTRCPPRCCSPPDPSDLGAGRQEPLLNIWSGECHCCCSPLGVVQVFQCWPELCGTGLCSVLESHLWCPCACVAPGPGGLLRQWHSEEPRYVTHCNT